MYTLDNPTTAAGLVYRDGNPGIFQTALLMRDIVSRYKTNLEIRSLAMNIVSFLPGKDERGEIEAIFCFVRDHIRYVKDIYGVETIATPDKTLEFGQGDCDDQSVLLATLLESIGYQTGFKLTGYNSKVLEHVYVVVQLRGGMIFADPTEQGELGEEVPGAVVEYYVF